MPSRLLTVEPGEACGRELASLMIGHRDPADERRGHVALSMVDRIRATVRSSITLRITRSCGKGGFEQSADTCPDRRHLGGWRPSSTARAPPGAEKRAPMLSGGL
jgi:hypothetical protein